MPFCFLNNHSVRKGQRERKVKLENNWLALNCSFSPEGFPEKAEFLSGWPKSLFRFSHNILQKNLNKLFGQPSVIVI